MYASHPSHEKMIHEIGGEIIEAERGSIFDRISSGISVDINGNTVISEGGYPLLQGVGMKLSGKCENLIHLAADETLMNIFNRLDHYSFIDGISHKLFHNWVDGVLAVSPRLASEAHALGIQNVKITQPFTTKWKYNNMREVEPDLKEDRVIILGTNRPANNFDLIPNISQNVESDVKFEIIGPHTNNISGENINTHGFVDKERMKVIMSNGSLSLAPAISQAFPVGVLECMHMGLPPLITDRVGTRPYIQEIHPKLVSSVDAECLAQRIDWYMQNANRKRMSKRTKETGEIFSPKRGKRRFGVKFNELMEEIN